MKICKWSKCGNEFEPTKFNQDYCKPECRHAHNNWLKMTGVHFIPQIYNYVKGVADSYTPPKSVSEMANLMMLKMMNREESELSKSERPREYLKSIEGLDAQNDKIDKETSK